MLFIRRLAAFLLSMVLLFLAVPLSTAAEEKNSREVMILFTHDIHSHVEERDALTEDGPVKIGGASRLATLLNEERRDFGSGNVLYVDGGDFSQGTLFQAGYLSDASELRLLARLGCDYVTLGNHEWDLAGTGLAEMLRTAVKKAAEEGEILPGLVCSNLDFTGDLTEEQKDVQSALSEYGAAAGCPSRYTVKVLPNGLKVGIFGLSGLSSIEDSPTSGMKWINYIEEAKVITGELTPMCDLILCLSHCGTGSAEEGEDIELAKACPDIDVIVSAHSHSAYTEPVKVGATLIVSCGEYMDNLGVLKLRETEEGGYEVTDLRLDSLDESVEKDSGIEELISGMKQDIDRDYLSAYRAFFTELDDYSYDGVIAHSSFDFISLSEMYATHDEYPLGDLIADSYLYEAKKQGINDIDVALVGLGTIRNSISEGDITLADAFEICSLGVGGDRSAGHPLVTSYITGAELSLLLQLDSSLGPMVSSIKMSYAGLRYSFNTERMLLDRVTEAYIMKDDGTMEEIEEDRLYKVVCNLYAANMLGMLNSLTKGTLKITPKDESGADIADFASRAMKTESGTEIKEWVAFADYLSSFQKNGDGISEIPLTYGSADGRKYKYAEGGAARLKNPGLTTVLAMVLSCLGVALLVFVSYKIWRSVKVRSDVRHRDRDKVDSTEVILEAQGQEKRHRDQH